jgi:solute carrier family 25 phosphate transporter 23/24/25/41
MAMDLSEPANLRDARIEALWRKLNPQTKKELSIDDLKKGLKRIDHPLKNASDLVQDVVKAMDKNGDNVIEYEGTFCRKSTEGAFLLLFSSFAVLTAC